MNKNNPTILIILGITGDLTAKKVVPALFNLHTKGALGDKFKIVGFGRKPFDNNSIKPFIEGLVKAKISNPEANQLQTFLDLFYYHQGQFDQAESYTGLKNALNKIQETWKTKTNRLFYLAIPPDIYQNVFENLKSSGLSDTPDRSDVETRILVEKPFGVNSETAEKLDSLLSTLFAENKIYRIDHYLAKEMVQNILTFRFSNDIFEKIWNNTFIEKIEIRTWETLDVKQRGAFYDAIGTLRDVGQNHLLQMLALTTMDAPVDYSSTAIQLKRAQLMKTLKPLSNDKIKNQTYRAQHEGYRSIAGVKPDSQTETYFRLKTELDNSRWRGVPIYMEAGKSMHEQIKDVIITFKKDVMTIYPGSQSYTNRIIFSLEPDEAVYIEFWVKKPGLDNQLEKRTLDFMLREASTRVQYVEEYEKLLVDSINGDQTLFVSTSEVKSMWAFIDPITSAWAENAVSLKTYKPDTDEAAKDSKQII